VNGIKSAGRNTQPAGIAAFGIKNIDFPVAGHGHGNTVFDAFVANRVGQLFDGRKRTNFVTGVAVYAFRAVDNGYLAWGCSGHVLLNLASHNKLIIVYVHQERVKINHYYEPMFKI